MQELSLRARDAQEHWSTRSGRPPTYAELALALDRGTTMTGHARGDRACTLFAVRADQGQTRAKTEGATKGRRGRSRSSSCVR